MTILDLTEVCFSCVINWIREKFLSNYSRTCYCKNMMSWKFLLRFIDTFLSLS